MPDANAADVRRRVSAPALLAAWSRRGRGSANRVMKSHRLPPMPSLAWLETSTPASPGARASQRPHRRRPHPLSSGACRALEGTPPVGGHDPSIDFREPTASRILGPETSRSKFAGNRARARDGNAVVYKRPSHDDHDARIRAHMRILPPGVINVVPAMARRRVPPSAPYRDPQDRDNGAVEQGSA